MCDAPFLELRLELEQNTSSHHGSGIVIAEGQDNDEPRPKKPGAFYLDFIGFAVTVLLLRLNTIAALSDAFPVSLSSCLDRVVPNS